MQSYVREQILQTVAVIIKRGTIDTHDTDKDTLFNDVTQLISSGHISMASVRRLFLNNYAFNNRIIHLLKMYSLISFPQNYLFISYILSVYSPLHNIPSLFLSVMDIFFHFSNDVPLGI